MSQKISGRRIPGADEIKQQNTQKARPHQQMHDGYNGNETYRDSRNGSYRPRAEAQPRGGYRGSASQRGAIARPSRSESTASQRSSAASSAHRNKRWTKKKVILVSVLGLFLALIATGGVYAYRIWGNPYALFTRKPSVSTSQAATTSQDNDSYFNPSPQATLSDSHSMLKDKIVNVLLIGIDYNEDRAEHDTDKDFHTDVMMVAAINFDKQTIDLISLPRDTYVQVPGVKGIYKMNAAFNCGGGMEANGSAGFLKTCETASWLLGGIPIDYYYAVTMPSVVELVDTIGGIDYDLESDFELDGKKFKAGYQHMDGDDVLKYLRVRKQIAETGDKNRVNRQKKMMVAIFNKLKSQNMLTKLPGILNAFSGQLYTNCSLEQATALASFAYTMPNKDIGMYSVSGPYISIFNWAFVLTDQDNRVEVIKKVYDVDVPKNMEYSRTYASYRWQTMIADQYLKTCEPLDELVSKKMKSSSSVSSGAKETYKKYQAAYDSLQNALDDAAAEALKYTKESSNSLESATDAIEKKYGAYKAQALSLASAFGYSKDKFEWKVYYETDTSFNEVYVNFR